MEKIKFKPLNNIIIYIAFLYLIIMMIFAITSYARISEDFKYEQANKAMILAIDIANRVEIDNQEFYRLLSTDFNNLLKDKANIEFEKTAREVMKYSNIKYIYLEAKISEHLVKYMVEKDEVEKYNMPAGTPLNIIYLLDAVVDYETRMEDTSGNWYVDKDRYTVMTKELKQIFDKRKPGYFLNKDQWGTYITGFSPYYDNKGNYIGFVGVDLFIDHYMFSMKYFILIIIIFLFTEILIVLLTLYFYTMYIKAQKKAQKQQMISNLDDLTFLLNRRRFIEILKEKWKDGTINQVPLSLLIIDIDFFKEFNDTYGHIAGDHALRSVAKTIKDNVPEGYSCRYGGDEFLVLLINADNQKAQISAENIINSLNRLNIEHAKSSISSNLTISIGYATLIPQKNIMVEKLIYYADVALYNSKGSGRNRAQGWNKTIKEKPHIYSND